MLLAVKGTKIFLDNSLAADAVANDPSPAQFGAMVWHRSYAVSG